MKLGSGLRSQGLRRERGRVWVEGKRIASHDGGFNWFSIQRDFGGWQSEPIVDETDTFIFRVDSRLKDAPRGVVSRYSNDDQQREFPGDTGFQFANDVDGDQSLYWGGGN